MTASAFSLSLLVPSAGLEITAGEPVLGGLQGPDRHHFCPHCKAWLFTRPAGLDELVNVRASVLDDHAWYVPFIETYTSEKLAWASTPARESFAEFPPEDRYPAMMQAFAAHGARPGRRA